MTSDARTPQRSGGPRPGRGLARHTVYNLVGFGSPALIALLAIPALLHGLGPHRFGILMLVWTTVGYFSLFNLGVGRALTHAVAGRVASGREREVPTLIWTALLLSLLQGVLAGGVLYACSSGLVGALLRIPAELRPESLAAFRLLAFTLPILVSNSVLAGVLEARERFDLSNAVGVPSSALTYLAPLVVLPFAATLVPIIGVLVLGRVLAWVANLALCLRIVPSLRVGIAVDPRLVPPLLRYGGWATVSNIVSPLMVYLDRFVVGMVLSVSAVAYYATAQEVVLRLGVISGAAAAALFPAISGAFLRDRARTVELFDRGLRMVLLMLFPVALVAVTFAGDLSRLWLGADFAQQVERPLHWLAIGLLVNGLAKIPSTAIQAMGHPEITARLHLLELPIYLLLLAGLLPSLGIEGAAIAWVARIMMDAAALFWIAWRRLPQGALCVRRNLQRAGAALVVLGAASQPTTPTGKFVLIGLSLALFVPVAWCELLTGDERARFRRRLWLPAWGTDRAG